MNAELGSLGHGYMSFEQAWTKFKAEVEEFLASRDMPDESVIPRVVTSDKIMKTRCIRVEIPRGCTLGDLRQILGKIPGNGATLVLEPNEAPPVLRFLLGIKE